MVGGELFAIDSLIFPGLACSYSLVCVDNNMWKQKSSENKVRVHYMVDTRQMGWGGEAGPNCINTC